MPLLEVVKHLSEPGSRIAAPIVSQSLTGLVNQARIPGHDGYIEQAQGGCEVPGGRGAALGHRPDTVVQPNAAVPQRIPQTVGEIFQITGPTTSVME